MFFERPKKSKQETILLSELSSKHSLKPDILNTIVDKLNSKCCKDNPKKTL
jgi:hypothetical protein